MATARVDARAIFDAAIAAVNPVRLVSRELRENRALVAAIAEARNILVIGGGKAGGGMALGVEDALANQLERVGGFVNVPDALVKPTKRIRLVAARPAGCNELTDISVATTELMLDLIAGLARDDVVICLLSGGGSALLSAPALGISVRDKIVITRLLIGGGATITELNCVRKHLSRVKGGQLAAVSRAGSLWSLILSDVEGDRLDVIASGPTAPDPTTFAEAFETIKRRCPIAMVPSTVMEHLRCGVAGGIAETPTELPPSIHNVILANNDTALDGAQGEAERRGYKVVRCPSVFSDTAPAALAFTSVIRHALNDADSPTCILRGGETTVRLPPRHGLGGRNQQLALEIGRSLSSDELTHVTVLCAGTDGEDGPTDAAGAIFDINVMNAGLDPYEYLCRHDSYHFFEQAGGLLTTGLTGTNVMDVHLALVTLSSVRT